MQKVCNYIDALSFATRGMAKPKGLLLTMRLLREALKHLMQGDRGADKLPGKIRTSQNWIGGTLLGNAVYVPPPPNAVPDGLSDQELWKHGNDALPPLIRAGLAHV